MKTISIINLSITEINSEMALFNCEDSITGVIHAVPSQTTVVLDGGYVLGQFPCVHRAVDELTEVQIKLRDAENKSGTYASYKDAFRAGAVSSRIH